jgi:hypothetical protein
LDPQGTFGTPPFDWHGVMVRRIRSVCADPTHRNPWQEWAFMSANSTR